VTDPYVDREQTKTKHFILKGYLEALAFKVLTFSDITYVDGFSGPWEAKTEDFSDSSFMIAIDVLKTAQRKIFEQKKIWRNIRCFFSENDSGAYAQLVAAVSPHDKSGFQIKTFSEKFEDAIVEINNFVGSSFPLIFIDPTGWTGYSFSKIKPLLNRDKCEVLINFMYDFVNRFVNSGDPETIASLDPILGGPGWQSRLDASQHRGVAVEKLFRQSLKEVGGFEFVVSTKIDKSTADRPHFFMAYGTKNRAGLLEFRKIEFKAQKEHAKSRANANDKKRFDQSGIDDLFSDHHVQVQQSTIDDLVEEQKSLASTDLLGSLSQSKAIQFAKVVDMLLQSFMLRETNVKDICVDLFNEGKIENTWGSGNRKPRDESIIKLMLKTE
jgi:three-Cys-motif partner protein